MKRVTISGASGFVGTNLGEDLKKRNMFVNEISLRSKGWKSDINKPDVFINLVGKAHDCNGESEEKDYYFVNVEKTKKIFEAFIDSTASMLIHVSSIAALQEIESLTPLIESEICNPVSIYGNTKKQAEDWLLGQKLPKHKKVIILRPPMVHGPYDKGNLRLLFNLISNGVPYPLSSFDNRRSFISIDNFCFFIRQIIEKQELFDSGIYHVADDETISTKEIINIIKKVSGKKVLNIAIPKVLIRGVAKLGNYFPIPINSMRLNKMTSTLIVSNSKIKKSLQINKLPLSAEEGIYKTIQALNLENKTGIRD